jgi:hypothetical protein
MCGATNHAAVVSKWQLARTKTVGARLRIDDRAIRAQMAFSHAVPARSLVLSSNGVFCTDALFVRAENTVGVRSAQAGSRPVTAFTTA